MICEELAMAREIVSMAVVVALQGVLDSFAKASKA
jgi:hypothetical protein